MRRLCGPLRCAVAAVTILVIGMLAIPAGLLLGLIAAVWSLSGEILRRLER